MMASFVESGRGNGVLHCDDTPQSVRVTRVHNSHVECFPCSRSTQGGDVSRGVDHDASRGSVDEKTQCFLRGPTLNETGGIDAVTDGPRIEPTSRYGSRRTTQLQYRANLPWHVVKADFTSTQSRQGAFGLPCRKGRIDVLKPMVALSRDFFGVSDRETRIVKEARGDHRAHDVETVVPDCDALVGRRVHLEAQLRKCRLQRTFEAGARIAGPSDALNVRALRGQGLLLEDGN